MKYLILFLLLFNVLTVEGQADLLEKKGFKCFYKGQVYKCKELNEVYKAYPVALDLYNSGLSNKRAANIVAIIGVPFIVGGVFGVASDDIAGLILGTLAIASGIVIEIIALIPRGVGSSKLTKARKIFNYEMIERHGYQSETSLLFGVTKNGIGLVFHF